MKRIAILLSVMALLSVQGLEVGGNCLAVSCEPLEGKCCERSDLELKLTLADNCRRMEFCDVNDEWEGVCKSRNFYIEPTKLYPGDPCSNFDFKTTCSFGLQRCGSGGTCLSVG